MIHLNAEQFKKLRHELEHPNPEAIAKRDAFLAALNGQVQINVDCTRISVHIPDLTLDKRGKETK